MKSWFKLDNPQERAAKEYYAALVTRARQERLYTDYRIPDTLDGRFEAIILHLFIEEKKQQAAASTQDASWLRMLHESFFEDMDRSLREGGVGDTGISKRVQRMASGFYGRLASYHQSWGDDAAFAEALMRNVYGTRSDTLDLAAAERLMGYIKHEIES